MKGQNPKYYIPYIMFFDKPKKKKKRLSHLVLGLRYGYKKYLYYVNYMYNLPSYFKFRGSIKYCKGVLPQS